ncbi:hypothetical protein FWG76_02640 [Candidatus Saccharibacteria bacterium]|nr:hypothetical protein [Candidatus Saccharibacteria bacterium]
MSCQKHNTIDIVGPSRTVPMKNVPQGVGFMDLLAFIKKDLVSVGYINVIVKDNAIVYAAKPNSILKSAGGYYITAIDQEETIYVPMYSVEEFQRASKSFANA